MPDDVNYGADSADDSGDDSGGLGGALANAFNQTTTPEAQQYSRAILNRDLVNPSDYGESQIFGKMQANADQVRQALESAKQRLLSYQTNPAQKWLALGAAFGAPTRSGRASETFGNVANSMSDYLNRQQQLEMQKGQGELGYDQQIAGVDSGLLNAQIALANIKRQNQGKMDVQALKTLGRQVAGQTSTVEKYGKMARDMLGPNATPEQITAKTNQLYQEDMSLRRKTASIPAGYEPDPTTPGALRPIAGGPHDPNATAAGMDSRSSVMFNRVAASAQAASKAIQNISELPVTTSTGWFGSAEPGKSLYASAKNVLAQKVTGQEAQDFKTMVAGVSRNLSTIETAGLAPNGAITHSMDQVILGEGDTQMTKLRKMAEMRQIVEENLKPQLANPKLAPAQKQLVRDIIGGVQQSVPFTHHDITLLQQAKNPQATIMDFAVKSGLPGQTSAASGAPVHIASDDDYNSLPSGATFVGPDGHTRKKP